MFVKDLETLKYVELQKLAKSVGIKANQKIDKLIQALKNHYIENEAESEQDKHTSDQISTISQNLPCSNQEQSSTKSPKAVQTVDGVHTPENKLRRKRRRTFELDTPTLGFENTPSSDGPKKAVQADNKGSTEIPQNKRVRRNTFNKDSPKGNENKSVSRSSGSPGTKAIIESIKADMNSPERKEMILSAIDKKVQKEKAESQPSQIPRYMAYLANKTLETQQPKPPTPGNKNWSKIHDKEFSRFDSIDVYLEKKQQRMESLTGSARKASHLSSGNVARVIKPVIRARRQNTQPIKNQSFHLTKTPSTERKEAKVQGKPFMPTVTSVKNLNFNFLKSPSVNEANIENKEVASVKKPHIQTTTPFKFTGNQTCLNSTVSSTKKCFDLKASLSKPLSWKPHTGKLMPLDKKVSATVSARPSRQVMASKTRPAQAKDVERVKQLDRRNNQKYTDMMRRRGLTMD